MLTLCVIPQINLPALFMLLLLLLWMSCAYIEDGSSGLKIWNCPNLLLCNGAVNFHGTECLFFPMYR